MKFLYAYLTSRCNARCFFCYSWRNPRPKNLDLQTFEAALDRFKPEWVIFLGGEPLLLALRGSKPSLMEFISMAREFGCKVAVQTNGILLDKVPEIFEIVDEVTVSTEYVSTAKNRAVGRWPKESGMTIEKLADLASSYSNLSLTSVYLGDNLDSILLMTEWSLINGRSYLIKTDKLVTEPREDESEEDYWGRLSDYRTSVHALYRSVLAMHKAYGVNPFDSPVFMEEPSWVVFLAVQHGVKAGKVKAGCSAGRGVLALREDGLITPCPLAYCLNHILGTVRGELREFDPASITGAKSRSNATCRDCIYSKIYGCTGCAACGPGACAATCPMFTPAEKDITAGAKEKLSEIEVG